MAKRPRSDRFQIKFNSEDVHPDNIRIKDLAQVLQSLEEGLIAIVKKESTPILENGLGISLVGIKEGCAAVELKPIGESGKAAVKPAMKEMLRAIKTKDRSEFPSEVAKSIQRVEEFSLKYECNSEFRLHSDNKRPNAVVRPPTILKIVKDAPLTGETTIYGKVESVGGASSPAVWLRQSDGTRFQVSISYDMAPDFGKKIYSWVGLRGYAQWENDDGSLQSFKLIEILDYDQMPLTEAFDQLTQKIGGFFEEIDDVNAFVEDLRRE